MPDNCQKSYCRALHQHPPPVFLTHRIVTPLEFEWGVRTSLHTQGLNKSIGLKEMNEIGCARLHAARPWALCLPRQMLHQASISNLAMGFGPSFLLCPLPIFINNMFIKAEANFELVRVHPPPATCGDSHVTKFCSLSLGGVVAVLNICWGGGIKHAHREAREVY